MRTLTVFASSWRSMLWRAACTIRNRASSCLYAIDWLVDDLGARTGINALLHTSGEPRRLNQRGRRSSTLPRVASHPGIPLAAERRRSVESAVVDDVIATSMFHGPLPPAS